MRLFTVKNLFLRELNRVPVPRQHNISPNSVGSCDKDGARIGGEA